MARTGRPPSANPRTEVIPIRLARDELADIAAAAIQDGVKTGDYIRSVALKDARRPARRKPAKP